MFYVRNQQISHRLIIILIIIFMASITKPSSNDPCGACKFLRRKCTPDCIFAPYFQADNPEKFFYVHRVFGARNVAKLLGDLPAVNREAAVYSLSFEAEARLHDPVHGCIPQVIILQKKLKDVQEQLAAAKNELAQYEHGGRAPHLAPTSSSASPEVPLLLQRPNADDSNTNHHRGEHRLSTQKNSHPTTLYGAACGSMVASIPQSQATQPQSHILRRKQHQQTTIEPMHMGSTAKGKGICRLYNQQQPTGQHLEHHHELMFNRGASVPHGFQQQQLQQEEEEEGELKQQRRGHFRMGSDHNEDI